MSTTLRTTTIAVSATLLFLAAAPLAQAVLPPLSTEYELVDAAWAWDDISASGTAVPNCDDCVFGPYPLGFEFIFYGDIHTEARVSTNGFLTFSSNANSGCCSGAPMPSYLDNIVAGYWDDLYPGVLGGQVKYQTINELGNERFVLQFTNVRHYYAGPANTFQIVLFKTGDIEVRVQTGASDGSAHTIGIERDNSRFLQAYHGSGTFSQKNFRFVAPLLSLPGVPTVPSAGDSPTEPGSPIFQALPVDSIHQDVGPVSVHRQAYTADYGWFAYRWGYTSVYTPVGGATVYEDFQGTSWGYKHGYVYAATPAGGVAVGYLFCTNWNQPDVFVYSDATGFHCQATPVPLP